MPGQLLVVAGPDQGRTFFLQDGQTVVVGRGVNTETRLTDPHVSRDHCRVRLAGERLHLTDSGSSSGTLVNSRRVVEHDVADGDTFQVGATCLRFQLVRGAEAATVVMSGAGPLPAVAGPAEGRYRHLKTRPERGALVLALTEHQILDDELAEALRVEMLTAVGHAGARAVVVDFDAVKSVSSAAFRPFVSLRRRLEEHGGRLILCGLTVMVAQVFRMSETIETAAAGQGFETADDVTSALDRLGRAG